MIYPLSGWFRYYDQTCDYRCQITEYIYWGLTSILGALEFSGRLREITDQWQLNTKVKVKGGDPKLYRLLTDPSYAFPQRLLHGHSKTIRRR